MKYIRWLLSIVLIIGVGYETGIFTTIFAFLVLVSIELIVSILKTQREILQILSNKELAGEKERKL